MGYKLHVAFLVANVNSFIITSFVLWKKCTHKSHPVCRPLGFQCTASCCFVLLFFFEMEVSSAAYHQFPQPLGLMSKTDNRGWNTLRDKNSIRTLVLTFDLSIVMRLCDIQFVVWGLIVPQHFRLYPHTQSTVIYKSLSLRIIIYNGKDVGVGPRTHASFNQLHWLSSWL